MKVRFAILLLILCTAGVFLYFEDELTPDYRNLAVFMPVGDDSASGSGRRMEVSFDYVRQKGAGSNQFSVC